MLIKKFERLINRKLITLEVLGEVIEESRHYNRYHHEDLLIEKGIPKHEILFSIAEHYGYPFIEYDEKVAAS